MAAPETAAVSNGTLLTIESAAKAFEAWEIRYRENPTGFLTTEEVARMEVATVAERSAIYFLALREVA